MEDEASKAKEVRQEIKDIVKEEFEALKMNADDVDDEDEFEGIIKHFSHSCFSLRKEPFYYFLPRRKF